MKFKVIIVLLLLNLNMPPMAFGASIKDKLRRAQKTEDSQPASSPPPASKRKSQTPEEVYLILKIPPEEVERLEKEEAQRQAQQQRRPIGGGPILDDIEIVAADGRKNVQLKPGEKVALRAVAHAYDERGNDIGRKIEGFSPTWEADMGKIVPDGGTEVVYIAPHSFKAGPGWRIDTFVNATQINSEGRSITGKYHINFWLDPKGE